MSDWRPPEPLTYVRPACDTVAAERLDAEYFAPRVQELLARLSRQNLTVGTVATLRKDHFRPADHDEFDYIEISDLTANGETGGSRLPVQDAPDRAAWYVRAGDVITSTVRPVRRLSALIRPDQDGAVCSSGFAVLTPHAIPSEELLVYLRLPLIAGLMDLHTTASMYPAISVPDILAIPFLKPSDAASTRIVAAVQKSHAARREAAALLARAKRAVEIAIEQDEEAAMGFLGR